MSSDAPSYYASLAAGGIAGLTVDVALFPLDTLKTRLQAPQGFFQAGGFKGLYKGMQSVALGSAPGSALFFITYDTLSTYFKRAYNISGNEGGKLALTHLVSASLGEMMALIVRVPTDNVKVKLQSGMYKYGFDAVKDMYTHNNSKSLAQFFKGFNATIMRDVPFAMIQYPLYEFLKRKAATILNGGTSVDYNGYEKPLTPIASAVCGSIAGGVAAAVSTPLDVVRTRLMIGKDNHGKAYTSTFTTLKRIFEEGVLKEKLAVLGKEAVAATTVEQGDMIKYKSGGIKLLFSGVTPRIAWISIGGSVFFGAYESAKYFLQNFKQTPRQL